MKSRLPLVVAGVLLPIASAFAQVDLTAEAGQITTDGTAAITAIGGALVGLAVVAVVYKWAKGMIFG
jgi:uncharacterized membrane protein